MVFEPGVAVTVPSQLLLSPLGEATCSPAGSTSVNWIPVKVTSLFGLLIVKLNWDCPASEIVSGTKTLLMVGGKATDRVAEAESPVPPSVELTGPVLLT